MYVMKSVERTYKVHGRLTSDTNHALFIEKSASIQTRFAQESYDKHTWSAARSNSASSCASW
jgi:hypothetical protein